jgi:hypothetical protein
LINTGGNAGSQTKLTFTPLSGSSSPNFN